MSHDLQDGATAAVTETASSIDELRKLYYARSAFAVVWAGLLAVTASALTPVSIALLVVYPLFDVAAAAYDVRSSGATRPRGPLHLNMVLSLLTAIALPVAASSGIPSVLRVWGAWAITAGTVQVVVAMRRKLLGGQRAMVLSGSISVVAGATFVLMAAGPDASLTSLAGYATLGGVFFLISAIRLHRAAVTTDR
jgi:uncharacterized membrane protein HdeD (DUF308 family)